MSCHVKSCHVMSRHVMSCHVMSCHVTSTIAAVTCFEPSASAHAVLNVNLLSNLRATLRRSAVVPASGANMTGSVILSIDRWQIDKARSCLAAVSAAAWLWVKPTVFANGGGSKDGTPWLPCIPCWSHIFSRCSPHPRMREDSLHPL